MPRISADERAAAFYRAGRKAPPPPKMLSHRAKAIWRQIVAAKPIDWFDGGNLGYLADHCETQVRLEGIWAALRQVKPGTEESRNLTSELKTIRGNWSTSSRHLRLTVQEVIERHAAKANEHQAAASGDELVGGNAVKIRKVA
jgi:hypothetical protein